MHCTKALAAAYRSHSKQRNATQRTLPYGNDILTNRMPWLEKLRQDLIVNPIQKDARTTYNKPLGKESNWIFNVAIGGGQADFDLPVDNLSPRDRVMLYALFNQKAHVDELIHAFKKFLPDTRQFQAATIIDIGCGPFTAGLALANVIGQSCDYRYYGVDTSSSMLSLAADLSNAVRAENQLSVRTEISFHEKLSKISFGPRRGTQITLFILSYLLASKSIDVKKLVSEIDKARNAIGLGPTFLLYTNSAKDGPRQAYPLLKEQLLAADFKVAVEEEENFTDTEKPRNIHYALFVRHSPKTISIEEFLQ
ncbi:class I SAM-dependent methyltransferase [Pseudomonas viridiflava]|uniref:class I SAM-dependent methyltransferase n=2 Tax=Pseudomonas viridiflava TaxID=33069 RepID=UPI0013CE834B|nr:class I SAM-dependent methyltransferase [Pseudomonas viridiflava]